MEIPYMLIDELPEEPRFIPEIKKIINETYPLEAVDVDGTIYSTLEYLATIILFIIEDVLRLSQDDKLGALQISRCFTEWCPMFAVFNTSS